MVLSRNGRWAAGEGGCQGVGKSADACWLGWNPTSTSEAELGGLTIRTLIVLHRADQLITLLEFDHMHCVVVLESRLAYPHES